MALRGACGLRFPHPTPALLSENQHIIGRKLSPQLEAGAPTLLCPTPHLGPVLKLGDHPPQTGEQSTWPGAGQLDGIPCEADVGSPGRPPRQRPGLSPDLVPKASSEPPPPRPLRYQTTSRSLRLVAAFCPLSSFNPELGCFPCLHSWPAWLLLTTPGPVSAAGVCVRVRAHQPFKAAHSVAESGSMCVTDTTAFSQPTQSSVSTDSFRFQVWKPLVAATAGGASRSLWA